MFKLKDRYKLESQRPETIKLFGSTKQLIEKTKNGENVRRFELFEVVQINLILILQMLN